MVCADIRGGSLERGRQTTGVIENMDLYGFRRYVFSTLRNETNVITYYYLIPCRLSTDPEIYDLGWLWMAWMFIIRYSICCEQCLRQKMLSDIFSVSHSLCICRAGCCDFRTWHSEPKYRRKQRNPVENVTKCYLIKILTQRNKQEYVN